MPSSTGPTDGTVVDNFPRIRIKRGNKMLDMVEAEVQTIQRSMHETKSKQIFKWDPVLPPHQNPPAIFKALV